MQTASDALILAFVEDGELCLFSSTAAACARFEGIDVESGVVQFFDGQGTSLEARFSQRPTNDPIFGLIGWVRVGEYQLVPKQVQATDSLALALHEARYMRPTGPFKCIDDVRRWLRDKGLRVDWPADG